MRVMYRVSESGEEGQCEVQLDHDHIDDIDEERAHHRHHQKRDLRRAVALRHRLHIGNGGRRGAQAETTVPGRQYCRIVVAAHDPEGHEYREQRHHQRLHRQDDEERQRQGRQVPQLQRHQGDRQEQ